MFNTKENKKSKSKIGEMKAGLYSRKQNGNDRLVRNKLKKNSANFKSS
jgi:hypothetical protein